MQHQVEPVVADIGAKRALQHDDGLLVRIVIANPEIEREGVPTIHFEDLGKVDAFVAIEAERLAADAAHALNAGRIALTFSARRFVGKLCRDLPSNE